MYKIVLLRHGESTWNKENRFTGWTDVDLTEKGIEEAKFSGRIMKEYGFEFDIAYVSVLKRALRTLWLTLEEMDQLWIPWIKTWRLNERHYGALQGLNKAETAAKHGEEKVKLWRRSYDIPPPELEKTDQRYPGNQRVYKNLDPDDIPTTECLKDTVERFLPFWHETIAPVIKSGKRILIAAHGNSLRALVKYLDNMTDFAFLKDVVFPVVVITEVGIREVDREYLDILGKNIDYYNDPVGYQRELVKEGKEILRAWTSYVDSRMERIYIRKNIHGTATMFGFTNTNINKDRYLNTTADYYTYRDRETLYLIDRGRR